MILLIALTKNTSVINRRFFLRRVLYLPPIQQTNSGMPFIYWFAITDDAEGRNFAETLLFVSL